MRRPQCLIHIYVLGKIQVFRKILVRKNIQKQPDFSGIAQVRQLKTRIQANSAFLFSERGLKREARGGFGLMPSPLGAQSHKNLPL